MQILIRNCKRMLTAMLLLAVGTALYAQTGTSEAWATNGSKRMEHRQAKALETSTKASTRITLDPEQTYQTVDGFILMFIFVDQNL